MEIIKREQAAEFDAFVKSHYKASFMQGSPWAGVKKNWQWRGVISRGEDGKIDGTMALLIRKVPGMPYSLCIARAAPSAIRMTALWSKSLWTRQLRSARNLTPMC